MTHAEWVEMWTSRTYRCIDTGIEFKIPDDVKERDFFIFGNCFIDVGRRGFYSRFGGNIQVFDEKGELIGN